MVYCLPVAGSRTRAGRYTLKTHQTLGIDQRIKALHLSLCLLADNQWDSEVRVVTRLYFFLMQARVTYPTLMGAI